MAVKSVLLCSVIVGTHGCGGGFFGCGSGGWWRGVLGLYDIPASSIRPSLKNTMVIMLVVTDSKIVKCGGSIWKYAWGWRAASSFRGEMQILPRVWWFVEFVRGDQHMPYCFFQLYCDFQLALRVACFLCLIRRVDVVFGRFLLRLCTRNPGMSAPRNPPCDIAP